MNKSFGLFYVAVAVVLVAAFILSPGRPPASDPAGPAPPAPAPAPAARAKLYLFSTASCPWCRKQEGELDRPEVKAALARFDFAPSQDDRLMRQYGVHAVPTWVEADAAGKKAAEHEGYMDAGRLVEWLAGLH